MSTTVEGMDIVARRLAVIARDVEREAAVQGLRRAALKISNRAKKGIQKGPATGKVRASKGRSQVSRASAPGEWPMSDFGRLAGSIRIEPTHNGADVIAGGTGEVNYAAAVEFKSASKGGRPFMRRALHESEAAGEPVREIAKAVRKATRPKA